MLSKHKLTRQIPLTTTYYDATLVINNPDLLAYAFYPQTGQGIYANVNNSKGVMQSGYIDRLNGGNLSASITNVKNATGGNCILRDMGKTMYTNYLSISNTTPVNRAFFRQVQLISPSPLGANSWNGGPNGSTFGVTGYPNDVEDFFSPPFGPRQNTTSYLTFYIPVTIANIVSKEATNTGAYAIAGGQL
jgi:hypothetical protein